MMVKPSWVRQDQSAEAARGEIKKKHTQDPKTFWLKEGAGWHSHLDGGPQLVGVVHGLQHQQAQDDRAEVPAQLRGQVVGQVLWAGTAVRERHPLTRHRGLAAGVQLLRPPTPR